DLGLPTRTEERQPAAFRGQAGFLVNLVAHQAVRRPSVEDDAVRPLAIHLDADDHVLRLDELERHGKALRRLLLARVFLGRVLGNAQGGGQKNSNCENEIAYHVKFLTEGSLPSPPRYSGGERGWG